MDARITKGDRIKSIENSTGGCRVWLNKGFGLPMGDGSLGHWDFFMAANDAEILEIMKEVVEV